MPRFYQYDGELMGLANDDNHLVFRWLEPGCKILFSVSRQGNGASCHFAADKNGLRKVKQAIVEFCEYCFDVYNWCTMVLAKTKKQSVGRLVIKCGFEYVGILDNVTAYARYK